MLDEKWQLIKSKKLKELSSTTAEGSDQQYTNMYIASHSATSNYFQYCSGYWQLLLVDQIFQSNYSLLDVGCGTAGYHKLLSKCGKITGIDKSKTMINAAKKLSRSDSKQKSTFIHSNFDTWDTRDHYDVVDLSGTFGWYEPWHDKERIIEKGLNLINNSGILIVSFTPPKTILQAIKAMFFPSRTVVIKRKKIIRMIKQVGGVTVDEFYHGNSIFLFLSRNKENITDLPS